MLVCFHVKAKPPLCAEFLSSVTANEDKLSTPLSTISVYRSGRVIAHPITTRRTNQSCGNATERREVNPKGVVAIATAAVAVAACHWLYCLLISTRYATRRIDPQGRGEGRKNQIFPLARRIACRSTMAASHPLNPIA